MPSTAAAAAPTAVTEYTTTSMTEPPIAIHTARPPTATTATAAVTSTVTGNTTTTSKTAAPSTTTAANPDELMKLAITTALLRSKFSSQPPQRPPQPPLSSSPSNALRWKLKAKDRKKEVIRLKEELKHLEDDLRGDLYPESASCRCYFFNDLQGLIPKQLKYGADHKLSDVLRRRFLRQVRLHKRMKKSKSNSIDQGSLAELYSEDVSEQLKLSAEFLVDLCESSISVNTPHYTSLTHQAVDFIKGSLNHGLSVGRDAAVTEGIISSLIMHLLKRMTTPIEDELYCDPENDAQDHVQHIIRQLGSVAYIGQRVLLGVCHRISEQAEILSSLDPFDESFAHIHDSLFVMIQLIEILVSDYIVTWSKDEGFDISLFEEWATSFLDARMTLQSMENRSGIYAVYMDRVTGELARQVGQISFLHKLNHDIIDNLFT